MEEKHYCMAEGCTDSISEKVKDFSEKKYNLALCFKCQKDFETRIEKSKPISVPQQTIKMTDGPAVNPNHRIKLQGKDYITHSGLLNIAHGLGLVSIISEMVTEPNADFVVFKATVQMCTEKGVQTFTDYGDADASNVNKNIAPHKFRMASTRAINRALRLAINRGEISGEEFTEYDKPIQ